MNIRTLAIALIACLSLPAAADFTTVSRAYEIALSNFQVPATANSGVTFKQCADCELVTVRATPETRYVVDGKAVSLQEFRKDVLQIRNRTEAYVTVKHHLELDVIESISVARKPS